MNFIKSIFDGKTDNLVHLQFQRFSRGEFRNRAIIEAKQSKRKYTIKTSSEFANELVRDVAEKLGEVKTHVTGAIVSTIDLTGQLDFKDKKQFQGVKRYLIDSEMSGKEVLKLMEKFPKAFFALSFETEKDNTILKIKPKAQKSGKTGSKGESPKADFCKLVTNDEKLGQSFVFEKPDFREARINHTFLINEIIKPESETDYVKIRELAKRKGKIIRTAKIDSQEIKSEKEFEV